MNELPYMQQADIEAMARVLEERKPAKVLEYGAGTSSLYWPQRYAFIKLWMAIEHDLDWAIYLAGQSPDNLMVICIMTEPIETYVVPPQGYAPFDMIIIDGLHRVECIEASPQYLAPDGAVLLHDADRLEYRDALNIYPHCQFLTHGNTPDEAGEMTRDGLALMWGDE